MQLKYLRLNRHIRALWSARRHESSRLQSISHRNHDALRMPPENSMG